MSVIRQANLLSQQRLDLPVLRGLESAVAADFDVLAGMAWAGGQPLVIRGLSASGQSPSSSPALITLTTADAIVFNQHAAVSGSFLWIPPTQAPEILDPLTNGRVTGGWTPNATNYVGLSFNRAPDDSTADLVKFLDLVTLKENGQIVPLAQTLDYTIVISTLPFSSQLDVVPVLRVILDSYGNISAFNDARPMMWRLGSGGDNPNKSNFYSAWSRSEAVNDYSATAFAAGDKSLSSFKGWADAVMTRLLEIGGGENWYSATSDRNATLVNYGAPLSTGEYFTWSSGTGTLRWTGLRLVFGGSTAYSVDITSGTVTGMVSGEVLYVDAPRSSFYAPAWVSGTAYAIGDLVVYGASAYKCTVAGTSTSAMSGTTLNSPVVYGDGVGWQYVGPGIAGGLIPAKTTWDALGTGSVPGTRWVLAWCVNNQIFTRNWRYPVGSTFIAATDSSTGVVQLNRAATNGSAATAPQVISVGGGDINYLDGSFNYGLLLHGSSSYTISTAAASLISFGGALTSSAMIGVSAQAPAVFGLQGSSFALTWATASAYLKTSRCGIAGQSVASGLGGVVGLHGANAVLEAGPAEAGGGVVGYGNDSTNTAGGVFVGGAGSTGARISGGTGNTDAITAVPSGTGYALNASNTPVGNVADLATWSPSDTIGKLAVNRNALAESVRANNTIMNGDFRIAQRKPTGAGQGISTYAFCLDRWGGTSGGVGAYIVYQGASEQLPDGSVVRTGRVSRAESMIAGTASLCQDIDSDLLRTLLGRTVTLSFWARASTLSGSVTVVVDTSTNSSDAGVAENGTGWAGPVTHAVNSTITQGALNAGWAQYSYTFAVGSTVTAMCVRFACAFTMPVFNAGDVYFANVMLTPTSVVPHSFVNVGGCPSADFNACLAYYEKSFDYGITPMAGYTTKWDSIMALTGYSESVHFTVPKRATPTIFNIWSAGTGTAGNATVNGSDKAISTTVLSTKAANFVVGAPAEATAMMFNWEVDAEIR